MLCCGFCGKENSSELPKVTEGVGEGANIGTHTVRLQSVLL